VEGPCQDGPWTGAGSHVVHDEKFGVLLRTLRVFLLGLLNVPLTYREYAGGYALYALMIGDFQ
jgi:hypothetical protein